MMSKNAPILLTLILHLGVGLVHVDFFGVWGPPLLLLLFFYFLPYNHASVLLLEHEQHSSSSSVYLSSLDLDADRDLGFLLSASLGWTINCTDAPYTKIIAYLPNGTICLSVFFFSSFNTILLTRGTIYLFRSFFKEKSAQSIVVAPTWTVTAPHCWFCSPHSRMNTPTAAGSTPTLEPKTKRCHVRALHHLVGGGSVIVYWTNQYMDLKSFNGWIQFNFLQN